jgi:gamma-glutamylcyclotransferase (GGCT)/AIG2-like uncharacterized protein YtfP
MKDTVYLPLFVYGTLLSDQPAFDLIAGAVERSAQAQALGFIMANVGRYPLAAPGEGMIVGELHWLRREGYEALLALLTDYEGPEYRRTQVEVVDRESGQPITAWLFLGDPALAARLPPVPQGDWRAWVQRQNGNGEARCSNC